jgi:preprotein translocase subunit SecD
MNKYPLWKYLLIFFAVAMGCIYAAPNLYSPDPAIQITGEDSGIAIDNALLERSAAVLKDAGIPLRGKEFTEGGKACLLRLEDHEGQLAAQGLLQRALGDSYVIALNLAPTTPRWLAMLGARPMKLGLDLSGGVHFLLEVDTPGAVKKRIEIYSSSIKRILREAKVRGSIVPQGGSMVVGRFADEALANKAAEVVHKEFPELQKISEPAESGVKVSWSLAPDRIKEIEDYSVSQNLTTLRNRVNELGVAEPLIQRQGRNRIVVELPGVQDAAAAKRVLGKTASLEFRLEARGDDPSREEFEFRDSGRGGPRTAWLQRDIVIAGERVTNAQSGFDPQTSRPEVNITLDSDGGTIMNRVTRDNVGQRLGVLFIERKSRTTYSKDANGVEQVKREPYYERHIISLATIQTALGVKFRITGLDNPVEASELALLLRAGALAAPMDFIEERTVGPSLGADNISRGFHSTLWGFVAIAVFMCAYYMLFGLISVTALATNLVLLLSLLSILQATLTLPGIAAIALALGMAIDANVLINERIREELRNGLPPQSAISAGYERAFATIVDSNVTTFIVGIMLLAFGSGPVRGFAVVHCLGILTSIFSAVMVSRAIVNLVYGSRPRLAGVAIGQIWRPDAGTATPSKR